jgi:predicted transcriptional regulator
MQSHAETRKLKQVKQDKSWVTLEDPIFVELILRSIGDEDKKNIITCVIPEPRIVSDIIKMTEIPHTSGYRKINALINEGLLVPRGYFTTSDGKRIVKYTTIFDDINILLEKNKVVVKIHLQQITQPLLLKL